MERRKTSEGFVHANKMTREMREPFSSSWKKGTSYAENVDIVVLVLLVMMMHWLIDPR